MQRFWDKVDIKGPNDCWLWKACIGNHGYGNFWLNYKWLLAHRVAWALIHGEPTKCVLHTCDVHACVNPSHLFEGTHKDNYDDMVLKGRSGSSKLTKEQVVEIRERLAEGQSLNQVCTAYDIGQGQILAIRQGTAWTQIEQGV